MLVDSSGLAFLDSMKEEIFNIILGEKKITIVMQKITQLNISK
jgi:hypothetical protein